MHVTCFYNLFSWGSVLLVPHLKTFYNVTYKTVFCTQISRWEKVKTMDSRTKIKPSWNADETLALTNFVDENKHFIFYDL